MLIIRQSFITRSDLKANPQIRYVFGDNLTKKGLGGQAAEMRGEPNAYGISTKASPTEFAQDTFDMFMQFEAVWDAEFATLLHYSPSYSLNDLIIVFPLRGIGTGLAAMSSKAPILYATLCKRLEASLGIRNI